MQEAVCKLRDDSVAVVLQTALMAKRSKVSPNHLSAWREFRQMTQAELAEKVKTTKSVVSLLESGDRGLSDKWLRRFAPALKTTPGAILDYDPNHVATAILEIWANIPSKDQDQAMTVLRTFVRKAG